MKVRREVPLNNDTGSRISYLLIISFDNSHRVAFSHLIDATASDGIHRHLE